MSLVTIAKRRMILTRQRCRSALLRLNLRGTCVSSGVLLRRAAGEDAAVEVMRSGITSIATKRPPPPRPSRRRRDPRPGCSSSRSACERLQSDVMREMSQLERESASGCAAFLLLLLRAEDELASAAGELHTSDISIWPLYLAVVQEFTLSPYTKRSQIFSRHVVMVYFFIRGRY
jgi:hypothetical protein